MTITEAEHQEIEQANESGLPTVVFIHGLWLLSSSWDRWRTLFEQAGYATVAPGWPDDPNTVAEARNNPDAFAHKMIGTVTEHYLEAIGQLTNRPAVVGHSFGGLIAQKVAGEGASAVTVAIDPAPFRGVLPLPWSALRSSSAVLGNPANAGRAIALTYDQFKFAWANNLTDDEAHQLYEEFHVPASGAPIFQAATANLNPWTEAKVDTRNPDRGPLQIIAGENDNTVPLAITRAMYEQQSGNTATTTIVEIPDRGHSLTIDAGWATVAGTAVGFLEQNRALIEKVGAA